MDPSETNTSYGMHSGMSQLNQCVSYQNAIGQCGLSNLSLEETYQHLHITLERLGNRILDINTYYNNITPTSSSRLDKTQEYDAHHLLEKRNQLVKNMSTNIEQLNPLDCPRSKTHADVNLKDRLNEEVKELKILKNGTQTMIEEANKLLEETANRYSELVKWDDDIFSPETHSEANELTKKLEIASALQKEMKNELAHVLSTVFPDDYEEIRELLAALVDASKASEPEEQYISSDGNPLLLMLVNSNLIIQHPEDPTRFKLEEFRF